MSEQHTYNIKCPRCGEAQDVTLYESINAKANPELREQLMANQINRISCPNCQLSFRVDKPILYIDPRDKILVYWMPTPATGYAKGEEQFSQWLREMGNVLPEGLRAPEVHLVFTRTELVERIFLLENKLNERVIEYVKYIIYSRNVGKLDPAQKTLLFNAQDSNKDNLCFVVQDMTSGQFEAILHYNRDAYNAICETFDKEDNTPDLLEMFPGPHISARSLVLDELKKENGPRDKIT